MMNVWTALMDFTAITASAGMIVIITVGGLLYYINSQPQSLKVRVKKDFRDESVH